MPISNTVPADQLRLWHDSVHTKLLERDLHTLSYNTDGAVVERTVSRSLQSEAIASDRIIKWSFPHPSAHDMPPLVFRAIRTDSGKPQLVINDGKH